MKPPPSSTAVEPSNGRNGSTTPPTAKGRPMPTATSAPVAAAVAAEAAAPKEGADMAEAVIDLSSYDWLAFPHWTKAVELDNFPKFLLWLTEQDAVLAGTVAMRQDEFELVFDKIKREMKAEATKGPTK